MGLSTIALAYLNLITKVPTPEQIVRLEICITNRCGYFRDGWLFNHCSYCKCPNAAKVRTLNGHCPVGLW